MKTAFTFLFLIHIFIIAAHGQIYPICANTTMSAEEICQYTKQTEQVRIRITPAVVSGTLSVLQATNGDISLTSTGELIISPCYDVQTPWLIKAESVEDEVQVTYSITEESVLIMPLSIEDLPFSETTSACCGQKVDYVFNLLDSSALVKEYFEFSLGYTAGDEEKIEALYLRGDGCVPLFPQCPTESLLVRDHEDCDYISYAETKVDETKVTISSTQTPASTYYLSIQTKLEAGPVDFTFSISPASKVYIPLLFMIVCSILSLLF